MSGRFGWLVILSVLGLPSLMVAPGPAVRATDPAAGAITLNAAPATLGALSPGTDLRLTGTVVNTTATALPAAELRVAIAADSPASRSELSAQLADPASIPADLTQSVAVSAVPAGGTVPVDVTVPAAQLDRILARSRGGAHAVSLALGTAGSVTARTSTSFLWGGTSPQMPVPLTTVLPVTVPPSASGLLDAAALREYTSPLGGLTRLLAALEAPAGAASAAAIDPMIIASIRALGSSAPRSAVLWLDRLSALKNSSFALQYADGDLALGRRAGSVAVPQPLSFQAQLDPANFPASSATPTPPPAPPSGTPGPSGTPDAPPASSVPTAVTPGAASPPAATPTPTPAPTPSGSPPRLSGNGSPPTDRQLLAFPYTTTGIAFPVAGTVSPADLPYFAAAGLSTTLVMSADLSGGPATPNSRATVGGAAVLVADSELSAAFTAAAVAPDDLAWRAAMARVSALLRTIARDRGSADAPMLAVLERGALPTAGRIEQTLQALRDTQSALPADLPLVMESAPAGELALADRAPTQDRIDRAAAIVAAEGRIANFASVIERPDLLTGPQRLRLLGLLSSGWLADPAGWTSAVATTAEAFRAVLGAVNIDQSSTINVVGDQAPLPILVSNALDYPATVTVSARPSNGRVLVAEQTATIKPKSSQRVVLPATVIANGPVTLLVSLRSPSGVAIGGQTYVQLELQAGWEAAGLTLTVAAAAALFGFGIFRNIRRRRRNARATTGDRA